MSMANGRLSRLERQAATQAPDDAATHGYGRHTLPWWQSLSRAQQLAELRADVAAPDAPYPPLCAARCPHHVWALVQRAGEQGCRALFLAVVARTWGRCEDDVAAAGVPPASADWLAFWDVVREVAGDLPPRETLPTCLVCEPSANMADDLLNTLPVDAWAALMLFAQRADWRSPYPSLEAQVSWAVGLIQPPPPFAEAWRAALRDVETVRQRSSVYRRMAAAHGE